MQKDVAETVARHLVAAGTLVDEDPAAALAHARYARRRASRIAVVREAAGIAAYHAGEWAEALSELRAARRMGGGPGHLAVMADIERAMGRPERAIELARGTESRELPRSAQIELAIVVAGARRDLDELDAAVVALQLPELEAGRRDPWSARLFYAYADNLLAAGRESDALQWFVHAADADVDGETDADLRIADLTGEPLADDGIEFALEEDAETIPDSPAADDAIDDPTDRESTNAPDRPVDHLADNAAIDLVDDAADHPVDRADDGVADNAVDDATDGTASQVAHTMADDTVPAADVVDSDAADHAVDHAADGVADDFDLNRNFPWRWKPLTGYYYSGPRPASEPETRAAMRFMDNIDPDYVVSIHTPLYGLDVTHAKDRAFARRLSNEMRLPNKQLRCNGTCHGTLSQWFNHAHKGACVTIEFGANPSERYLTVRAPRGLVRALGGTRGGPA